MLSDCLFLRRFASRALIAAALALAFVPGDAFAACASPSGTEGEIAYNSTYHVTQFCDGSSWISMAAAATYLSETDPKVGTLTALKWCATNAGGTAIDCTLDAPLRTANNLSDLASAATARTNLGLGSIATQAASAVGITGGTIDSTAIGGTTPAAGAFTTISASGAVTLSTTLNVTGVITGVGSGLTTLNASNLSSGTVATARLGSGSASATTFLRGDNSWAAPTGGTLSGLTDVSLSSPSSSEILSYNGTAWTNSAVGSLVAGVAGPTFMVHKNGTNQSVTANAYTKLTWSSETFDTNNNFASDRFTPTVAGQYYFSASILCNDTPSTCQASLYKNGSPVAEGVSRGAGSQGQVNAILDMNGSTDYVEIYIYDASATTIEGTSRFTYFSGSMLAPLASGVVAGTGSAGYVPYWTSGNALTYDSTASGQFYWDSTNHRLGIGTTTPTQTLDVYGVIAATNGGMLSSGSSAGFQANDRSTSGAGVFYRQNGVNYLYDSTVGNVIAYNGSGNVGIGTATIASTAILDLVSTAKGFLPPRMTTAQRDAISSPATGLTLYNTTTNQMNVYTGSAWATVGGTALSGLTTDVTITSAANNDILQYSSGTSKWVNTPLVSAVAGDAGPSFHVHKNGTNQTVTDNVITLLIWSAETFDTNNNFASNKFTPTVAGKYIFNLNVYCPNSTQYCIALIYKNGAAVTNTANRATGDMSVATTIILDMNGSTDYVEAYARNTGGTTVSGSSDITYFTGGMLAPLASGTVAGTGSAGYLPVWTSGNAVTYDSTASGQLVWDLTNHRLGIGTATPSTLLHVNGATTLGGAVTASSTLAVTGAVTASSTITGSTGVGIGTTSVAASSILDMVSTTKGMLPPRMTTTQRDAISSPATGLTIYNTTSNQMNVYNGTAWGAVGGGAISGLSDVTLTSVANNDMLRYNGSASVNIPMTTAMTTTTMVANWPDAISCTNSAGNGRWTFVLLGEDTNGTTVDYFVPGTTTLYVLFTKSTGLIASVGGYTAPSDCAVGTSVSNLYAAGHAFNFIGTGAVTTFDVGTAAAPGLAVTSDTNTGLWSAGADTLNISTGGVERLRVDSSGNVGIGTTSPTGGMKLDVNGVTYIRGDLYAPRILD